MKVVPGSGSWANDHRTNSPHGMQVDGASASDHMQPEGGSSVGGSTQQSSGAMSSYRSAPSISSDPTAEDLDEWEAEALDAKQTEPVYGHYRFVPEREDVPFLVPFEDLGDPRENRHILPPSTARWRFTSTFRRTDHDKATALIEAFLARQLPKWKREESPIILFPSPRERLHSYRYV